MLSLMACMADFHLIQQGMIAAESNRAGWSNAAFEFGIVSRGVAFHLACDNK